MRFLMVIMLGMLGIQRTHAQNFLNVVVDSSKLTYNGLQANQVFNITLYNPSGIFKNYNWQRTDLCELPIGWSAWVCDCSNCYPPESFQGSSSILDSCFLQIHYSFTFGSAQSNHTIQLELYDPSDSVNSVIPFYFSINGNCQPNSSVEQNFQNKIIIAPNPIEKNISITANPNLNITYCTITNSIGKIVKKVNLLPIHNSFSIDDLASGFYFLQLFDTKNQHLGTHKIYKQ